jgi:hypothetical protein
VNEALGDLCLLKSDRKGACNYYEQVSTLYTNSGGVVGIQEKLRFLEKLRQFYQQQSSSGREEERVLDTINTIKKNS